MKKSLLIASLAVISMNVLGMNPIENNNLNRNNLQHILTPDSSPNRNSTHNESDIQYLDFAVQQCISGALTQNQRNTLVGRMYQQILNMRQQILKLDQTIESKNKENDLFACYVEEKDKEISNMRRQLDTSEAEKLDLENRVRQYEEFYSDLEFFISSRKPSSTFQPSDTEHVNNFDAFNTLVQVALSDEWAAESNQSGSDSDERFELNQEENINQNTMTESEKDSTTPVNLENDSNVEYLDESTNNSENSDEEYTESDHSESNQSGSDSDERFELNQEENINQNTMTESEKDSTTPVNLENDSDVEYLDESTNNSENSDEEYIESDHSDEEYTETQASTSKKRKLPSSERIFAKSKKQANELDLEKILQDIPRNKELTAAERKKLNKKYKISDSHCLRIVNSVRNWFYLSDSDRNAFIKKLRNPKNKKNLSLKTVGNKLLNVNVMIKLINENKVNKFSKGKGYAGLDTHRLNARVWKILIDEELINPSSSQSRA
jgi:hypothetical protein